MWPNCTVGASKGRCTDSLVAKDNVDAFIKQASERYGPYKGLEGVKFSEVIFKRCRQYIWSLTESGQK